MTRILLAILLAGALAACGTTNVGLKYSAAPTVARASIDAQPVRVGPFADLRGESATWLGVIRGGFGNHLKTLEADRPAVELVQTVFADALRARGAKPDGAANASRLGGAVRKLYCDQYVRREANVVIDLTVSDAQGQQRFARTYEANKVEGSALAMDVGIFASPEELRAVLERTLQEVVDKALDDAELRAALRI